MLNKIDLDILTKI